MRACVRARKNQARRWWWWRWWWRRRRRPQTAGMPPSVVGWDRSRAHTKHDDGTTFRGLAVRGAISFRTPDGSIRRTPAETRRVCAESPLGGGGGRRQSRVGGENGDGNSSRAPRVCEGHGPESKTSLDRSVELVRRAFFGSGTRRLRVVWELLNLSRIKSVLKD